jgi:four helix bundle protein
MDLSTAVYAVTKAFPKEEMFGLTSQLRRASVSVASNIAEGQGRLTSGEFIQFLGIARGSVLELQTQLELAQRLRLGTPSEIESAQQQATELLKILNSVLSKLRSRSANKPTSPN